MILLYHLVFPDDAPPSTWNAGLVLRVKDFQRQMLWLKRFYRVVSVDEYVSQIQGSGKPPAKLAALTFDDCFNQTFQVVSSLLTAAEIPATFFANTAHLEDGSLLWFVYFNALCFEKVYPELFIEGTRYPLTTQSECRFAWQRLISLARASSDARAFSRAFSANYPLPPKIIMKYQGLSREQLSQIGASCLFTLGGHTHSHPYLDQVAHSDQLAEMSLNKQILEKISGKAVNHFAYTGGIYNDDSISAVQKSGFRTGFAIRSRRLTADPLLEIPRMDIYSPSLLKFAIKISGLLNA